MESALIRTLNNTLTKFNATFGTKVEMLTAIFIQDDVTGAGGVAQFTCSACTTLIKLYTESNNGQVRWMTSNFSRHLNKMHQNNEVTIVRTSANVTATPQITTFLKKNDIKITSEIPTSVTETTQIKNSRDSFADFVSNIAPELVDISSETISGEA